MFRCIFMFFCHIAVKHDLWISLDDTFCWLSRIFQALYAGSLQRVSEVDELVARKVARGIGGIQTCPENMVLLTLYHKATTLGRCCSAWVWYCLIPWGDRRLHREGRDKKHEQGFLRCFCEGVIVVLFVGCCFWGGVLVVMFRCCCRMLSLLLWWWWWWCGCVFLVLFLIVIVVVAGVFFEHWTEPAPNSFPGCISRFGECNYFSSWFVMPFAVLGSSHCFHRYSSFMKCWFPYEFCCSTTRILEKYHADLACTSFFRHHLPLCVDWLF